MADPVTPRNSVTIPPVSWTGPDGENTTYTPIVNSPAFWGDTCMGFNLHGQKQIENPSNRVPLPDAQTWDRNQTAPIDRKSNSAKTP